MIKSKLVKENDILIEKPEFLKRINLSDHIYVSINNNILHVDLKNIKEYFIGRTKTLLNCKINFPEEWNCRNITEDYFYNFTDDNTMLSYSCDRSNIVLRNPILRSEKSEITSIQSKEIELNILFDNATLSEWYKNY